MFRFILCLGALIGSNVVFSGWALADEMLGETDNPSSCACNNNTGLAPYHVKNELNYSSSSEPGDAAATDSLGQDGSKK